MFFIKHPSQTSQGGSYPIFPSQHECGHWKVLVRTVGEPRSLEKAVIQADTIHLTIITALTLVRLVMCTGLVDFTGRPRIEEVDSLQRAYF